MKKGTLTKEVKLKIIKEASKQDVKPTLEKYTINSFPGFPITPKANTIICYFLQSVTHKMFGAIPWRHFLK